MRITKTLRILLPLVACAALYACGPLQGQLMKSSEGLHDYRVVKGDIRQLRGGKKLLVVGPFIGKGPEAETCLPGQSCIYPDNMELKFVTKYNDARRFAHGLLEAGLFTTELYLEADYDRIDETVGRLKAMPGREIGQALDLEFAPELILFGVVTKREHRVAPKRGVVVDVRYELEFYDPDSRQSILIEVAVTGLFKDDLKVIIQETKNRLARN